MTNNKKGIIFAGVLFAIVGLVLVILGATDVISFFVIPIGTFVIFLGIVICVAYFAKKFISAEMLQDETNKATAFMEKIKKHVKDNGLIAGKSKCEYCGSLMDDNDTVCKHCGAPRKE